MRKIRDCLGIDISKDVFDVIDEKGKHYVFTNDYSGFRKFKKILTSNSHCVMEATGYYYCKLAYYLLENGYVVSVENALSIKRFIQMQLVKNKTDKADARMIQMYGERVDLKHWEGQTKDQRACLQIIRLLETYTKQSTALKNKIHGEKVLGIPCKGVLRSLERMLRTVQKEIRSLEKELETKVKVSHQTLLTNLKSIPGIGMKTASMLVVVTDGFTRFDSSSSLCSYSGITPVLRQSGSSVRGRPRMSKVGNRKLRNLLFLCSLTASKYNKGCRELYQRIVAKGKSKKLALIAVCNKLLKQAYGIAKSGLVYDESYRSLHPGYSS